MAARLLLSGTFVAAILCAVSSAEISAETSPAASKHLWMFTHSERVAARALATRAARSAGAPLTINRDNRELFYPIELFRWLVESAFISLPTVYPAAIQQRSSDLFRDSPADWDHFRDVTDQYTELLRRERGIQAKRSSAGPADRVKLDREFEALREAQCAAAATAMRILRQDFGAERFDKMLYETVAASVSITVFDPEVGRGRVHKEAEQCR